VSGADVAAPWSADRAEHVAPNDGGTDSYVALRDELVIEALVATLHVLHLMSGAGGEHPLVQSRTAHPEWAVEALVLSGRVPVSEIARLCTRSLGIGCLFLLIEPCRTMLAPPEIATFRHPHRASRRRLDGHKGQTARVTMMVALLRGVNVGGKGQLAMADLRAIATELGYADVRTYIQSGNLVLSTTRSGSTVAKDLARAIASSTSVKPAVVVRIRSQVAKVVRDNPFRQRGEDPAHLHVVFMDGPAKTTLAKLDLASYEPEEARAIRTELYLFLPNGVGRSKLAADLGRQKGAVGTQRSWRTVTTLLDMVAR